MDSHPEFTEAMFGIYRRTLAEAHYNASHFHQMLTEQHGYDTALQLIRSPQPSAGFEKLWDLRRLDLTVEALVLQPRWYALFESGDLTAAHARLSQYRYQFPPDAWHPGHHRNQLHPQSMNRKQFIESLGATCLNWNWSWSFINESERSIIFGAWDRFTEGERQLILSEQWRINRRGRKSPGYDQSREHIRLIEEHGYRLLTFPMQYAESPDDEDSSVRIAGFTPHATARLLERSGDAWYAVQSHGLVPLAEEIPPRVTFVEGLQCQVTINAYERNPLARAACIAHYGCSCRACGFNFQQAYGDIGAGFIHVHHRIPIGTIGKEYEIDPVKDLIPVCPNCHAMIHKQTPPLTIDELQARLKPRT